MDGRNPAVAFVGVCPGGKFPAAFLYGAIELAAKENKMVFIDFYTTWCGPCKRMSKEVFPQQEVGEYFNRTFISLKLDAEKENGLERQRNMP